MNKSEEWVLCAAIWYEDIMDDNNAFFFKKEQLEELIRPVNINRGIVITGHRHGQCIWTMGIISGLRTVTNAPDGVGKHVQGFLTSKNRFVDRKEGAKIARNAEQVPSTCTYLFSEDLY